MFILSQMDEISSLNIKTDSTIAILQQAKKRGHKVSYYTPQDLSLIDNIPYAKIKQLDFMDNSFNILHEEFIKLESADLVLIRQNPPFDMNYNSALYILERVREKLLIINDPVSIRDCPEKVFINDFQDLVPKTIITSSLSIIDDFLVENKNVVAKPLYDCSGNGVVNLTLNDNYKDIASKMLKTYNAPITLQEFIPNVKNGDKRILLLNGKILGAINRIPKSGEFRANLRLGASAEKSDITQREVYICEQIKDRLIKKGLIFVGIDVIDGYLTEINVTSPTGIKEINNLNNINIEEKIIDKFEEMHLKKYFPL